MVEDWGSGHENFPRKGVLDIIYLDLGEKNHKKSKRLCSPAHGSIPKMDDEESQFVEGYNLKAWVPLIHYYLLVGVVLVPLMDLYIPPLLVSEGRD